MDLNDWKDEELIYSGKCHKKLILKGKEVYDNLMKISKDPLKYNNELLMKILEDNKDTEYGKKYDFANIKTIKDYQEKVQITTYDDYAEYIYRMIEKGEDNLITVYDVNHYAKSSGTMGNPKRIPVSILSEQNFSKYVTAYNLYMMYNELGGEWINYPVLNLVELSLSKLKNGADYSSISGKIIKEYDENLSEIMTSSIEAIMPQIETDTRYLHARFALTQEISYVFTSFVSLFLESLRYIVANWELLADDIEKGTIHESIKMTEEVRNSLLKKIKPMPERANHIRKAFQDESDKAIVPKIWPELCCLSGVGTGGFANYLDKINVFTGDEFNFYLTGLNASEGTFSVPFELNNKDAMLIPDSMFYEFLPLNFKSYNEICTIDELEVGKKYEIVTTNLSGFYRYRMKDIIKVIGKKNETPIIEFAYRLDQCLSLTGEKINEHHLRKTVYTTEDELGFNLIDFSVYADSDSSPMKYVFLLEIESMPEGLNKDIIKKAINKNFAIAEPLLGYKLEKGMLDEAEVKFLQAETYL
ncbi:MAG: GH3 auxin-responsive promoter family protein, partial [archaeon]|nr:GH3 auxin-responsive promoter family protein [archaeon]